MTNQKQPLYGIISDIQRFSTEDGPGIRTTVFFKGCNLRCPWCHNPETQRFQPEIMFYERKCTHCGACEKACPNALKTCDVCGKCVDVCPSGAREMSGKTWDVETLINEIKKDELFYQTSGGGVTFSGGECMLQIDFLEEVLKRCKQAGISTAVDTAGEVPFAYFERILPYVDLFLYDIKSMDSQTHERYVGVGNERILDNLRQLQTKNARIWVRIPIIEEVNATREEMQAINTFLKAGGGVERVELLPYHKFGEHKYQALSRAVKSFSTPSQETMQMLAATFDIPASVR